MPCVEQYRWSTIELYIINESIYFNIWQLKWYVILIMILNSFFSFFHSVYIHFHPDYTSQKDRSNIFVLILCQIFFAKIWSRVRYDISKTEARLKIEKRKISSWEMQNNLSFLFFFFYKKRYFSVKHFSFPTRYQYQFKYRTVTKVFEKKKNGKFCF